MRCPYCRGPVSRVRDQEKDLPEFNSHTLYRCLLCNADLIVAQEPSQDTPCADRWHPPLQLVWPRLAR